METETRYSPIERKTIANEILRQFAGGRAPGHFCTMTGVNVASLVALDGGIQFDLKPCKEFNQSGINRVRVILTPMDEYDVYFVKANRKTLTETILKEHHNIYCDQLADLFFAATNLLPYMGYPG